MTGIKINSEKGITMNTIQKILPMLQNIVEHKNCAINVSTEDNEVVVNIIDEKRTRCFRSADSNKILTNLKHYMQA